MVTWCPPLYGWAKCNSDGTTGGHQLLQLGEELLEITGVSLWDVSRGILEAP